MTTQIYLILPKILNNHIFSIVVGQRRVGSVIVGYRPPCTLIEKYLYLSCYQIEVTLEEDRLPIKRVMTNVAYSCY